MENRQTEPAAVRVGREAGTLTAPPLDVALGRTFDLMDHPPACTVTGRSCAGHIRPSCALPLLVGGVDIDETAIYLDLLVQSLDLDFAAIIISKFDAKSEEIGAPYRLEETMSTPLPTRCSVCGRRILTSRQSGKCWKHR